MGGSDYKLSLPGQDDDSPCPSLSLKQRVIGFACCLAFASLISILGFYSLFQREYVQFGVLNTVANVFALSSSFFLAGPKKQAKKMFEETRIIATIVYLLTMVLTFVCALAFKIAALVIVCVIIQYLAMVWYGLSYIPGARNCLKRMVGIS